MQSYSGPNTENGGLVMCDEVAPAILEALGIHDPVGKIEIIMQSWEPVEIKVTFVSHYKTAEGVDAFSETLKNFNLIPKP